MNKLLTSVAVLVVCILLISCENVDPFDIDNVDFGDPEIGVPLVNSTFFIADLGANPDNNTEVISDSEGRVTLRYSNTIPPISINEVFPPVDNSVRITTNPQNFIVPFYDIVILNADFNSSTMAFEIRNPTNERLNVVVTIDGLLNSNDQSFIRTFDLQPNELLVTPDIDLSNWRIEALQTETLQLLYSATTANSSNVELSSFEVNFKQLDFSYVDGKFGDAELPTTEDLIDISFFDSWVSGGLDLAEPKLIFDINNSIGIPAEMRLNFANVTNIEGETFELVYDQLNQGIAFNYPSINQVGETLSTAVEINGSNSNAVELFNFKPSMVDYDLDLFTNPSQEIGFYTADGEIEMNAIIELPLHMRANDLILQETIGFDEIEYDDIEGTGELKLSLINAFPISVGVNLFFMDSNGETLFTLVPQDEWVSVSANTDVQLTIADLEPQISCIPISEEDVIKIPQVANVLSRVLVTTTEDFQDEFVWVLDHHGVDIKLGAILR